MTRTGRYQAISTPMALPQTIARPRPAAAREIDETPLVHKSPLSARLSQAAATLSSGGKAAGETIPSRETASHAKASSSSGA